MSFTIKVEVASLMKILSIYYLQVKPTITIEDLKIKIQEKINLPEEV
jgi:hypothetical protein